MITAVSTRRRCWSVRLDTGCGLYKLPDEFGPRSLLCKPCVAARRRRSPRAEKRARTARKAKKQRWTVAPPAGRVPGQDAIWHQCDGADVHPDHRQAHRDGFWTEGHLVIFFIEDYCRFPDLEVQGEPIIVAPAWREMLYQVYTLRADGRRRYRRVLIGLPKKSAKTLFLALVLLYHTIADPEPTPVNVCAAASDDQANEAYGMAITICEMSPKLLELTGGEAKSTRFDTEIQIPSRPRAKLRRLATGGGNLDGKNLHVRGLDELHEWTTPKADHTFRVLNQAGAQRKEPLFWMITTAPWGNQEGRCLSLYKHGKTLVAGEVTDDAFLFIWWEAPRVSDGTWAEKGPHEAEEAGAVLDYRSEEGWRAANPMADVTVTYERFLEDCADPENTEEDMRRYRLNQMVQVKGSWLPEGAWERCRAREPYEIDPALRTVAFIDSSSKDDSTAIVWADATAGNDRVRVKSRIWERPLDPGGTPVEGWVVPAVDVERHLRALWYGTVGHRGESWVDDEHLEAERCSCGCEMVIPKLDLEAIGYDPFPYAGEAQRLMPEGIKMEEVPQTDARMVPATELITGIIKRQGLQHDGNVTLAQHVANAVKKPASQGRGWRLGKTPDSTRLRKFQDAAIGLVGIAYLLLQEVAADAAPTASVHVFSEEDDA